MKIVMKLLLLLMFMMCIIHGHADTKNHYITFELIDGSKVSVLVSSDVSLSFKGTTLFIGNDSFLLVNLKLPDLAVDSLDCISHHPMILQQIFLYRVW